MIYYVCLIVALFFLSFFYTLRQIIHNQNKYLGSAITTAFLGAYVFLLIVEVVPYI